MTISVLDFDKVERFRETVLGDIKGFGFSPEDELAIKVSFANFAHELIQYRFSSPVSTAVVPEVVSQIPETVTTVA